MVVSYQLFAWYATLEFYWMAEPALSPYSLGVALFSSGFLLNLRGTIGLPAKHVPSSCFLLHDQPSLSQQLFFPADHECILGMDRPTVDLRLPKLPILIAVFWTVMSCTRYGSRSMRTTLPPLRRTADSTSLMSSSTSRPTRSTFLSLGLPTT